jgi:hypothetical protein
MNQPNIRPRFEAHKLEGTAIRRIAKPTVQLDDKGNPVLDAQGQSKLLGGFTYENVEHDAGWMVYLPNGSSIRIWTEEEMIERGFLNKPDLIDMESGEIVPSPDPTSLKARSEQKERATKSSKVHHTT